MRYLHSNSSLSSILRSLQTPWQRAGQGRGCKRGHENTLLDHHRANVDRRHASELAHEDRLSGSRRTNWFPRQSISFRVGHAASAAKCRQATLDGGDRSILGRTVVAARALHLGICGACLRSPFRSSKASWWMHLQLCAHDRNHCAHRDDDASPPRHCAGEKRLARRPRVVKRGHVGFPKRVEGRNLGPACAGKVRVAHERNCQSFQAVRAKKKSVTGQTPKPHRQRKEPLRPSCLEVKELSTDRVGKRDAYYRDNKGCESQAQIPAVLANGRECHEMKEATHR